MKTLATLVLVTLTLVGCSSGAQLVRKDGLGGRVALQGAYMPAMADARVLMTEHCDGRYQMVDLGHALEFRCTRQAAPVSDASAVAHNDSGRKF
jgi:hypothetical protein